MPKKNLPKPETVPRFGEFLINRGIVDEEIILDALNFQKKKTAPIGKLALKKDLLNMKQVMKILDTQCNTAKRFGEIGIQLGFLKKEDLDFLLELQIKLRPPIGEILVYLKKISEATLRQELKKYFSYLAKNKIT